MLHRLESRDVSVACNNWTEKYAIIILYENHTRGTQEIIKLDITESRQTKQKVHSADSEH